MEIQWIANILLRDLEALKREIAAFPDDASVWAVAPGITNSAGTLTLHVAGNLRHFLGAVLGQSGYVRNREHEFAARSVPRDGLVGELDLAVVAVRDTLAPGRPIDPGAEYPELVGGGFRVATGDWLVHLATHLAFHLGQVGYLRRVVTASTTSVGPVSIPQLASAVKVAKASA